MKNHIHNTMGNTENAVTAAAKKCFVLTAVRDKQRLVAQMQRCVKISNQSMIFRILKIQ